ncbi:MAG: hypothetical protein GYA55_10935 [SAR324 cluster bacterium]|uniref:Uncharacterized protein n=1 Tax=SAR324 cluster bacterium TaxID=2024889 RepID=A0A7X9FSU2_9DELT|nr:hypothetical protein [SAR324 cluster bacterium]
MKIIAFITDPKEALVIAKSLGIPPFEKPQSVRGPPTGELRYEPLDDNWDA